MKAQHLKVVQESFPGQGSSREHHWSQFGQPSSFNGTHTQRVLLDCLHELIENNALGFLATEHRRRMDVHNLFAVQDFVASCVQHTGMTLKGVYCGYKLLPQQHSECMGSLASSLALPRTDSKEVWSVQNFTEIQVVYVIVMTDVIMVST